MPDQDALRALRRGEWWALEPLIRQVQVRAVRAAYLITRDLPTAEDTVAARFADLPRAIRSYDPERPFEPWFLRGVVRDAVRAAAVREKFRTWDEVGETAGLLAHPQKGPADSAEEAERERAVWEALDRLPPAQRASVVMRYFLDMNEREMSETLAVAPGTVKWRLHAARRLLRPLLAPWREEESR